MIARMISEIQTYLSSSMRDEGDFWENEERRVLHELLALLLTAERDLADAGTAARTG
jgi:hypothetical protein